jgi:hypothetical protein
MQSAQIARKIMFVAWADASEQEPFDLDAAAEELASIEPDEQVFRHGEMLTAVDHVSPNTSNKPLRLQLLALHDGDSAPSEWSPDAGATSIDLAVRPEQVVRVGDGCLSPDGLVWSSMVVGP